MCVCAGFCARVCYLIIFVPGQRLSSQDEPVLFGSALHDADVVDGEPAFTDHLRTASVKHVTDDVTDRRLPVS